MLGQRTEAGTITVPFIDLGCIHRPLKAEILEAIDRLIERNEFVTGPTVAAFEEAFSGSCGREFCVGLASGLDALRLSLEAASLRAGDEVIVPANTFAATFEAVSQAGGIPVPVDVGLGDYNLDPAAVEAAVGGRTRFLLPVHLYGQLADMDALGAIAERHGLVILEDACQAHGATRDGVRPGDRGLAAAFSFYPAKNLGAMGDAGATVTDDAELAGTIRALREHGQRTKTRHELEGWTARLDALQAAILSVKLPHLERWNDERRAVARAYLDGLTGIGDLGLPPVPGGSDPVWHLFVVRTSQPELLADFLGQRGIATGRHYPEPPHLSGAYASLGYAKGDFPVAESLARELLSLPIFPGMSDAQTTSVVDAVADYFAGA